MAIKMKTVVKKVSDYSESEVFFVDKKPMKECAICMEFIKDTDKTILKCGHEFHASCMFTNLVASNNTCPLCRDEISEKPEGRPDMTQGLMREFMQNEFNEIELSCYMEELFSLYGKKTENGLHWKDLSLEERAFISEPIISLMLSFGRRLGKQVHRWIEEGNERMVIPDEFQEDHFRIPLSAYQDDHDYDDMPPLMDPEEDDEHEPENPVVLEVAHAFQDLKEGALSFLQSNWLFPLSLPPPPLPLRGILIHSPPETRSFRLQGKSGVGP